MLKRETGHADVTHMIEDEQNGVIGAELLRAEVLLPGGLELLQESIDAPGSRWITTSRWRSARFAKT